ncbi:MAG: hypothetical protein JXR94_17225 [Candidatus Hydrogenedentes bacterium]|nr:hypothetical protein [Candidatus Hydrogenedentota bacterium]
MSARPPSSSVILFVLRFALLAPLCLALWWLILPWYASALGFATRLMLNRFIEHPIDHVAVETAGLLNTSSALAFGAAGHERRIAVGQLVSNMAPYIALVLATRGLRVRRRIGALAVGAAVLIACHGLYLGLAYTWADSIAAHPQLPTALAQLFLTLPFLLWITLVYWPLFLGKGSRQPGTEPGGAENGD